MRLRVFPKNTRGRDNNDLKPCKNNPEKFPVCPSLMRFQHLCAFKMAFIWSKYQVGIVRKEKEKKNSVIKLFW